MAAQWAQGDQNVQIENVNNAQIRISFGGGPPRLLPLEPATVPPGPDVSPARLVRARSGVVPFAARDALIARLETWLSGPEPFAACIVGGRGGTGKTKLAVELAERAADDGWVAGLLRSRADQGALDALAQAPIRRLVVIDYAETRLEQLEVALPLLAAQATAEHPLRVLLLIRARPRRDIQDWKEALRRRSEPLDALVDQMALEELESMPLGAQERDAVFTAATHAFANGSEDGVADRRPSLSDPIFASPLLVVIAAYLAVHGAEAVPTSRSGLLDELLRHEQSYWLRTDVGRTLDAHRAEQIVGMATLAGADHEAQARELLQLLPDFSDANGERLGQLARWAATLYPEGAAFWNPLEPDLLGEHLVIRAFGGQPEVLSAVLAGTKVPSVTHALGLFARALADRPDLTEWLSPVIDEVFAQLCLDAAAQVERQPDLELLLSGGTLADVLVRLTQHVTLSFSTLNQAMDSFPRRPDLVLDPLALAVTSRLVEELRSLVAVEDEADGTMRRVLAIALNDLSGRLTAFGRRDDAAAAIDESIEIRREIDAKGASDLDRERLAGALSNKGNFLSETGSFDEALVFLEEAVTIQRPMTAPDDVRARMVLGTFLSNLGAGLVEAQRVDEAVEVFRECLDIRRALADEVAEDEMSFNLAVALNNFTRPLLLLGRQDEALAAIREAVEIDTRLARDHPAAYLAPLSLALKNLGNVQMGMGAVDDAVATMHKVVDAARRLSEASPAGLRLLMQTLAELVMIETTRRQPAEALRFADEALAVAAGVTSAVEAFQFVSMFMSVALQCVASDDPQTGIHVMSGTVELARELTSRDPRAYEGYLILSLRFAAQFFVEAGRAQDAVAVAVESLDLVRSSKAPSEDMDVSVADGLWVLAQAQAAAGDYPAARVSADECLAIWRDLERHGAPQAADQIAALTELIAAVAENRA